MENQDLTAFYNWIKKSKIDEHDIIRCRKMQSMSISETSNAYGIVTISVSGFYNNDFIKLGEEIRQYYSENKETYYKRVYTILGVCSDLMDSVNGILQDEGSWSSDYFRSRIDSWYKEKQAAV